MQPKMESKQPKLEPQTTLPKLIVVCGPTATGKSDLAVEIALWLEKTHGIKAEIISADSRQVYKGLDLGTGKITQYEMKGVPHHLLDVAHPMQQYTVTDFKRDADRAISEILSRGHMPILCGGTGMYINAVVFDQRFAEVAPDDILRKELENKTLEEVQNEFTQLVEKLNIAHESIAHIDLKNKRRVIRAIEILKALGHIPKIEMAERFNTLWLGIDADDAILRTRIKTRIEKRITAGMLEEPGIIAQKFNLDEESLDIRMQELGLEYLFMSKLLKNEITRQEFDELLFFAIWHYAKRQRTWFKRNPEIHWSVEHIIADEEVKEIKNQQSIDINMNMNMNMKNDTLTLGESHHFSNFKKLLEDFLTTSDPDF